jgi:hypothetical protein
MARKLTKGTKLTKPIFQNSFVVFVIFVLIVS